MAVCDVDDEHLHDAKNRIDAKFGNRILDSEIQPNEIALPKSTGQYEKFIACVKSTGETLTPAPIALRSATTGLAGQIAMLTGQKLKWDPKQMRIVNNPEVGKCSPGACARPGASADLRKMQRFLALRHLMNECGGERCSGGWGWRAWWE